MENKVQCVEGGYIGLTKGDTYNVYQTDSTIDMVLIENDNGEVTWYDFKAFNFFPDVLPSKDYKESKDEQPITYKDFLASMPKSASACVTMYGDGEVIANVYGFEFVCKTEERAEEVYAALITLFKEDV